MRKSVWILAAFSLAHAQSFEVASIRLHPGPLSRMMVLSISGTRIKMEGYSAFMLVMEAYRLKNFQISLERVARQEEDLRTVMYDIDARTPGERPATPDDVRKMLQTLLAERFHLAVHRESKEMPVYALVAGAELPGLKESAAGDPCSFHVQVAKDRRKYEESFTNCGIDELVNQLGTLVDDRPVVDRTRLTGTYDFRLIATPAFINGDRPEPGDIDVFAALQGMGLKLERQKAAIEILTIDRVSKPTDN
ncbi:MAG: TIGR03435 family protein [Candidatus Sulfopaludibacter sp.]|nr:TIGR03435 family protein [Candidatus Sulfopaludibacter sp.]